MPQKMWKHSCPKSGSLAGSGSRHWMGAPQCSSCGGLGQYDGWHPGMHEAMAQYQTFYRLKPVGRHRQMVDELFKSAKAKCQTCDGRGLRDTANGSEWRTCSVCRGLGSLFTRTADEFDTLRRRVLAAYPDAGADPVPGIFTKPVIFNEAKQEVETSGMDPRESDTPFFDGFPYLVARVTRTLYHITLLPGEVNERHLVEIARAQRQANRFDICLVMAPRRALYFDADGHEWLTPKPPRGGILITGRLRPPTVWTDSAELQARWHRLTSFIDTHVPKSGYLFGDLTKGGREATADDVARLAGIGPDGRLRGLERCATCGEWRGRCLDPAANFFCQVMVVHCRCQNDNRCAACGNLLSDRKLNANYYDPADGQIWHVPGFSGIDHRCPATPAAKSNHVTGAR
jgi:hypothetical protein